QSTVQMLKINHVVPEIQNSHDLTRIPMNPQAIALDAVHVLTASHRVFLMARPGFEPGLSPLEFRPPTAVRLAPQPPKGPFALHHCGCLSPLFNLELVPRKPAPKPVCELQNVPAVAMFIRPV